MPNKIATITAPTIMSTTIPVDNSVDDPPSSDNVSATSAFVDGAMVVHSYPAVRRRQGQTLSVVEDGVSTMERVEEYGTKYAADEV